MLFPDMKKAYNNKGDAWYDYYYNGEHSEEFQNFDEIDMTYINAAFFDGFDGINEEYHKDNNREYNSEGFLTDNTSGVMKVSTYQSWKAGKEYQEMEIPA